MFMFLIIATIDPHNFARTLHRGKYFYQLKVFFCRMLVHLAPLCIAILEKNCLPYVCGEIRVVL